MEFTKLECIKIKQLANKPIAIAVVEFKTLINVIKFTHREPQYYDPFDPYKDAKSAKIDINNDYYQRLLNDDRLKKIYNYLIDEIVSIKSGNTVTVGTFPTSIILSIAVDQDYDNVEDYKKEYLSLNNFEDISTVGAYWVEENKKYIELLLPSLKLCLVVDGQHRLAGMMKLYNDAKNDNIKVGRHRFSDVHPDISNKDVIEILETFSLSCTILLGFDLWEQGKVFADVNFNQKPVNKSLYYDIFGSEPSPNRNDIFLAHMLAMHLNNNSSSVIKGYIKMLGRGDGFFSQAFFVEAILNLFKPKNAWGDLPIDYINGGNKHKILPKFLKAYFEAIRNVFKQYWPTETERNSHSYKNVLVKTTGMGALIRLIDPLYRFLKVKINLDEVTHSTLVSEFEKIINNAANKGHDFFSKNGRYAKAGSLGLQNELYKEIFSVIKPHLDREKHHIQSAK